MTSSFLLASLLLTAANAAPHSASLHEKEWGSLAPVQGEGDGEKRHVSIQKTDTKDSRREWQECSGDNDECKDGLKCGRTSYVRGSAFFGFGTTWNYVCCKNIVEMGAFDFRHMCKYDEDDLLPGSDALVKVPGEEPKLKCRDDKQCPPSKPKCKSWYDLSGKSWYDDSRADYCF